MGQFEWGGGVVRGIAPDNRTQKPSTLLADLSHEEFLRQSRDGTTPCPFEIGREIARTLEIEFGTREQYQIVEALVQASRQISPCKESLQGLCRLVVEEKLAICISEKREIRDSLLVILTTHMPQIAELLANQIFRSNKNPQNLPELFLIWQSDLSQEAWDNVANILGLGPTNRPRAENITRQDVKKNIIAAFITLTGDANKECPKANVTSVGAFKIHLRADDAKKIIFKILSLPFVYFEQDGTSVRWEQNRATLIRIEKAVGQWERGTQGGSRDTINDADIVDARKNRIRGIDGFMSLPERTKSDILRLANLTGPAISREVQRIRVVFEAGYKEEDRAISLLRSHGFGQKINREIIQSDSGSVTDQRGYDIAVGKDPNLLNDYIYFDVKSSPYGVERQLIENASKSGKQHLPPCLQELEVGRDHWRVVWRAAPLCFRNRDGEVVDDPAKVFYQAEQWALSQLDKLLET